MKRVRLFALLLASALFVSTIPVTGASAAQKVSEQESVIVKEDNQAAAKPAAVKLGWVKKGNSWYYVTNKGNHTGWAKINGRYYYFNNEGVMQTGFLKNNGKWYFFTTAGYMKTGWEKVKGKWYYFDPARGNMKTGWVKSDGHWYYLDPSGAMAHGWRKVDGKWYYLGDGGAMYKGPHVYKIDGVYYFFESSGALTTKTGIQISDMGNPFYTNSNGTVVTNKEINGKIINAEGIAVNSTAFLDYSDQKKAKVIGNPTEGALLLWLFDNNVDFVRIRDNTKIVKQLPFTTKYKYMATVVETPTKGRYVLYLKGAPEIVLKRCATVMKYDGEAGIYWVRCEVEEKMLEYQNKAMRTLGFAYKYITESELDTVFANGKLQVEDLCFLGLVGIIDPIRDDVADSVKDCLNAGISIKIVTGDTPGTAKEIGRQVGLWNDEDDPERQMITGKEFNLMTDEQLLERVGDLKIMSRARPSDKERLVRLLQERGEVVAVTGDGTNDAPALNQAQIGLSMGDGTSVAKEASDITILDNSFKSIARAVMWGRSLYLNIQRFILFQMTINVAACLIVLLGAVMGVESPLTVTQMLWINLIMDTFAAMALASLPPDHSVLKDKPRSRSAFIITKEMVIRIFGVGLCFVAVLFGFIQYFMHYGVDSMAEFSFSDYFASYFCFHHVGGHFTPKELSLLFTIFVFMQLWNIFNAKAYHTGQSALKGLLNKDVRRGFGVTLLIIALGQVFIVTFGGEMFNVVPLPLSDWVRIVLGTSVILWLGELERLIVKRK